MKALNNFKIQHKCLDCGLRTDDFFCQLSASVLKSFESLTISNAYPKGATLFMEGQPVGGIYMLCQGRVKLSTCSRDGKVIILRIAAAGEVLGLSETVTGSVYEATAEVIEPCQVNFVRKEDFLRFLKQDTEACFSAIKHLSQKYHTAYVQVRSFGLSTSVADKLAKLFLEWCRTNGNGRDGENGHENGRGRAVVRLKITYTHEEIAEMIGTTRETVTRLLKDFRERNLISVKGADLIILDEERLEATIGVRQQRSPRNL
jgi:CRP/FNR family transcriptional regulator, cyclic AMP receptor protein